MNGSRQSLPVINGTTGAGKHLRLVHKRDPKTGNPMASELEAGASEASHELVYTRNYDIFRLLLLKWFVFCQLALFMLENSYFRAFVSYLHQGLGELLPKARSTLRSWIITEFKAQKSLLAAELSQSLSKVHITFDIWTARNQRGYIAIWGYWIDLTGRQRRLLGFRRIYRSHTGENQAQLLHKVLKDFNIEARLGYCVSDNASSNDVATELLLKAIKPDISPAAIKSRRLRCFGHIVNLAAQSLLATTGSEARAAAYKLESIGDDEEGGEAVRARWIHAGPLGKLQRLVKYVLASGQRRDEFAAIAGGKKVKEYDHLGVSSKLKMEVFFSVDASGESLCSIGLTVAIEHDIH